MNPKILILVIAPTEEAYRRYLREQKIEPLQARRLRDGTDAHGYDRKLRVLQLRGSEMNPQSMAARRECLWRGMTLIEVDKLRPGCSTPGCGYPDGRPCIGCGRVVPAPCCERDHNHDGNCNRHP